jgi:hypothetical protein
MLTYKLLEIVGEGSKDQSVMKSNDISHRQVETVQQLILIKDSFSLC